MDANDHWLWPWVPLQLEGSPFGLCPGRAQRAGQGAWSSQPSKRPVSCAGVVAMPVLDDSSVKGIVFVTDRTDSLSL
jgi:hypothetical protein